MKIASAFWGLGIVLIVAGALSPRAMGRPSGPPVFAPVRLIGGDEQKAALGQRLFFDRRLSRSMQHSCASCHDLATNGATGARTDYDDDGQPLRLNTPTLFNAAYNFRFGWAGKRRTIRDMVMEAYRDVCKGAGIAPQRLAADQSMVSAFRQVYRSAPRDVLIADALSEFMTTLITPSAPFDSWLEGDTGAMTAQQQRGYDRFRTLGCASCHQGRNVGGNIVERRGIFHPLGEQNPRYLRVPSLRNVAVTAPYFHDGSAATLPEAVRQMAFAQLDVKMGDGDVRDVTAFLRALTGRYRGHSLRFPGRNRK